MTAHAAEIVENFEEMEGKDVCIAGRIMSWREMGKASFMDLHDRTGRMQVYLRINDLAKKCTTVLPNGISAISPG